MSKMIKTTDTDIKIEESIILVVEIGTLSFEIDERYPWIDVYLTGGESKEFVTQIDEENMPVFVEHEELKRYCLNWYFSNVEIIASEDIERTAPELSVQEQSNEISNGSKTINQVRKEYGLEPI
ncbi:hypothetical protein PMY35_07425 [Clostridium tertium]|uniref:hypothetical protein n=1 Tax=Clostridium tertium TaxID=1559 RepID=UPI001FAD3446|nr:hypothetical protein [Clostridium tertium]MDB1947649.1 hypothetical protein [Clostridium tertium]